jgi:hypothetical protein
MNVKASTILIILIIATITTSVLTYALPYIQVLLHGTVTGTTQLDVRFNGNLFANGQTLEWADVEPGKTYYALLNVTNKSNIPITLTLYIPDRPSGFIYAWTYNGTSFSIGETKIADFSIFIPSDALAGAYSFGTLTFDVS